MKVFILISLLFFAHVSFAQSDNSAQIKRDSVKNAIAVELNLSNVKSDSLASILGQASTAILTIARNNTLAKEERLRQIRLVAAQRDQKIRALLSPAQVQKLKALMSNLKRKTKDEQRLRMPIRS